MHGWYYRFGLACIIAARLRINRYNDHLVSNGLGSLPAHADRLDHLVRLCEPKEKEIGGWLLYYYIRLYIGAIIVILVIVSRRDSYLSEAWINTPDLYPFFLLTTVPGLLLYCAEIVVAEKLRRSRNYAYVPILRYILFANIVSLLIAIAINNKYFEGSSTGFFNIMTMIWPIVWIPYFYFSKRVKSVFRKPEVAIQIDHPGSS